MREATPEFDDEMRRASTTCAIARRIDISIPEKTIMDTESPMKVVSSVPAT